MRLIIGGILPHEDYREFQEIYSDPSYFEKQLGDSLREQLEHDIPDFEHDRMRGLAWMLKHDKLEIKVGFMLDDDGNLIPPDEIEFHHKFGIFRDEFGNSVAFQGSLNETYRGWYKNGETITVFRSWENGHLQFIKDLIGLFDRLWEINGSDPKQSVAIVDLPTAVKNNWIRRFTPKNPVEIGEPTPSRIKQRELPNKWKHQEEAVEWFMGPKIQHVGILEMATGTGKTRTALKIANRLFEENLIDEVVIVANDRLLKQWEKEMEPPFVTWVNRSYKQNADKKEALAFINDLEPNKCLFITYHFFPEFTKRFSRGMKTLLIVDELHNLGADQSVNTLTFFPKEELDLEEISTADLIRPNLSDIGQSFLQKFKFRLGLSATPFSEYLDRRNQFIVSNFTNSQIKISDNPDWYEQLVNERWIFHFGLKEAIQNGILTPFRYIPLSYVPSEEDLENRALAFRKFSKLAEEGKVAPNAPYIMASFVLKKSEEKIPVFESYLEQNPEILRNCIIFVATKEYGEKVTRLVQKKTRKFRTFFSGDPETVLDEFRKSNLETLITCRMISEGIDIRGISNIILFSADRVKLGTIQRIGRALRKDPTKPNKIATVVDFVYEGDKEDSADIVRKKWLEELSQTEVKQ